MISTIFNQQMLGQRVKLSSFILFLLLLLQAISTLEQEPTPSSSPQPSGCTNCVLLTEKQNSSFMQQPCQVYFQKQFNLVNPDRYQTLTIARTTFRLVMSLYEQRLCVVLHDHLSFTIYSNIYTRRDIGKQIHKNTDLQYIFNSLTLLSTKSQPQGKQSIIPEYTYGEIVKIDGIPYYKLESSGILTVYMSIIDRVSKQEVDYESRLWLDVWRKMNEMQILGVKFAGEKNQMRKKWGEEVEKVTAEKEKMGKQRKTEQEKIQGEVGRWYEKFWFVVLGFVMWYYAIQIANKVQFVCQNDAQKTMVKMPILVLIIFQTFYIILFHPQNYVILFLLICQTIFLLRYIFQDEYSKQMSVILEKRKKDYWMLIVIWLLFWLLNEPMMRYQFGVEVGWKIFGGVFGGRVVGFVLEGIWIGRWG